MNSITTERIALLQRGYAASNDTVHDVPVITWADAVLTQIVKDLHARIVALENTVDTLQAAEAEPALSGKTLQELTNARIVLTPKFMENRMYGWQALIVDADTGELIMETGVRNGIGTRAQMAAQNDGQADLRKLLSRSKGQ